MFFPTRTDRRIKRTPYVNYGLIAVNVLIFLFTETAVNQNRPNVAQYFLNPFDPDVIQFLSYQFLHAGKMHIGFNMLFLYVFGNAVEDRLGRLGYLLFYLGGGVLAGLGHCLVSENPVLGASGSIAAVTGAYLALFPMSNVTIVYWFFFIGSFEVSSMLLILFRVVQDLFFQFADYGNTAYVAHLTGYVTGFVVGMVLLFARILPREQYDMLALIEQKRRRSQFQRLTRQGYQPWQSGSGGATRSASEDTTPLDEKLMAARSGINEAIDRHDLESAASQYVTLIASYPDQVLGQQQQLDVANHLMSEGGYDHAATAYELFLKHFPRYPERHHVQLILGLIHGRYLDNTSRARELLTNALPHLSPEDKALAEDVLAELPR